MQINTTNSYCKCGCGQLTLLPKSHFVKGHQNRGRYNGENNPHWKGGRMKRGDGYTFVRAEGHPKAIELGLYVLEHVQIIEKVIGRFLRSPECVHHINNDPSDNSPSNLVLCPDEAYHMLLHQRQRAFNACGNANYKKCSFCKQYDNPNLMKEIKRGGKRNPRYVHQPCVNKYDRNRRKILKQEAKCQN